MGTLVEGFSLSPFRGYLALTEEGKARMKEAGIEDAYLGSDGRVHIPGKRVTLYSEPSPTLEELRKSQKVLTSLAPGLHPILVSPTSEHPCT